MHTLEYLRQNLPLIEGKLGRSFFNTDLLEKAFIHKSYINEGELDQLDYNERLEFLGDAVLDLIVTSYLFERFPEEKEGVLSELRAQLVDTNALIEYTELLNLSGFLVLSKGEKKIARSRTIFADLFEAIIGAIYLDGGFESAKKFFFEKCHEKILLLMNSSEQNPKAALQDYTQKLVHERPTYTVLEESGLEHLKEFKVGVYLLGELLGSGCGFSKKEAERNAAENALEKIKQQTPVEIF